MYVHDTRENNAIDFMAHEIFILAPLHMASNEPPNNPNSGMFPIL